VRRDHAAPEAAGNFTVRLAVEGSSTGLGRTPQWLSAATDIRFADYARDGEDTLIRLEAPTLGEAAPELYEQEELWATKPAASFTALDTLSRVVNGVGRLEPDSLYYDRALLKKVSGMQAVFSNHLQAVSLGEKGKERALLNEERVVKAAQLSESTPSPQEARVVGNLDMIRGSTRSFGLALDKSDRPLLLDTSVLLHLARNKELGQELTRQFELDHSDHRPLISVVTVGEIMVLADRGNFGERMTCG